MHIFGTFLPYERLSLKIPLIFQQSCQQSLICSPTGRYSPSRIIDFGTDPRCFRLSGTIWELSRRPHMFACQLKKNANLFLSGAKSLSPPSSLEGSMNHECAVKTGQHSDCGFDTPQWDVIGGNAAKGCWGVRLMTAVSDIRGQTSDLTKSVYAKPLLISASQSSCKSPDKPFLR